MQDLKDKLTVLQTSDGTTFSDISAEAFSLTKGTIEVSGTLYVGFRKPVSSLFFAVPPTNTNDAALTASYWNGSSWQLLDTLDESGHLSAPGFVRWETPEDEEATSVDGKTLAWYRFIVSSDEPATLIGIGPMLCSEDDLTGISFRLQEEPERILKAMATATKLMCQEMQLSAWDLLNKPDVSQAAAFLALSLIYADQSDRPDDHQAILAQDARASYKSLKAKIAITVDSNDNGRADTGERRTSRVVYFER